MKKNRYFSKDKSLQNILIPLSAVLLAGSLIVSFFIFNKIKTQFFSEKGKVELKRENLENDILIFLKKNGIQEEWIRRKRSELINWNIRIPSDIPVKEFSLKLAKIIKKYNSEIIENQTRKKLVVYIWHDNKKVGELSFRIDPEISMFKGNFAVLFTGLGDDSPNSLDYLFSQPIYINLGISYNGKYSKQLFTKSDELMIESWLYFKDDFIDFDRLFNMTYNSIRKAVDNVFFDIKRKEFFYDGLIWEKVSFEEPDFIVLKAMTDIAEKSNLPFILISDADTKKEEILAEARVKNYFVKDKIIFSISREDEEIRALFNNFISDNPEKIIILPTGENIIEILHTEISKTLKNGYRFKNLSSILN
ncbi:hypothetical protein ACFL4T_02005 [candidate division KSB1 bacterium]